MSNYGKFFIGVATAAAAGAVIGMLFAPEKGDTVRRKISDKAHDFADEFFNLISTGKQEANRLKEKWAQEGEYAKNEAGKDLSILKDKAQNEYSNLKDRLKESI